MKIITKTNAKIDTTTNMISTMTNMKINTIISTMISTMTTITTNVIVIRNAKSNQKTTEAFIPQSSFF